MTIVTDSKGNMFNAEAIIRFEHDIEEVKLLADALLERYQQLLAEMVKSEYWLEGASRELVMGSTMHASVIARKQELAKLIKDIEGDL